MYIVFLSEKFQKMVFFFLKQFEIEVQCNKNLLFDANIELAYPYNKIFNPVNFVFLSIQYIRLTT